MTKATAVDKAVRNRKWHWYGGQQETMDRAMTVDEAFSKALDWRVNESVSLTGVFGDGGDAVRAVTDTHKMLRHSVSGEVLGVVSKGFHVVQNRDLADLAIDLVGASALAVEAAFSMFGGRQVVMLLRGEEVTLGAPGLDQHTPYMVIANGHNGGLALSILPMVLRGICLNQITAALAGRMRGAYKWKHTSRLGSGERQGQIREAVRQWQLGTERVLEVGKRLSGARMTKEQIADLWLEVIQRQMGEMPTLTEASTDRVKSRRRNRMIGALSEMAVTFDREKETLGDNAYVAANAATNWLQHTGRRQGDSRFDANTFGPVAEETRAVFERALEVVG